MERVGAQKSCTSQWQVWNLQKICRRQQQQIFLSQTKFTTTQLKLPKISTTIVEGHVHWGPWWCHQDNFPFKTIPTHSTYLGLFQCLPHSFYVNYFPIHIHKHKILGNIMSLKLSPLWLEISLKWVIDRWFNILGPMA